VEKESVEWYLADKWGFLDELPQEHIWSWVWFWESLLWWSEKAYITGNYNKLFVHGNDPIDSEKYYIIASPSLITSSTQHTDIQDIMDNKKLSYDGWSSIPASYGVENQKYPITVDSVLLFEWSQQELSQYRAIDNIDAKLRSMYKYSSFYSRLSDYFVSEDLNTTVNILADIVGINPIRPYYCSDLLKNNLKKNIAPQANLAAFWNPHYWLFKSAAALVNGIKWIDDGYNNEFAFQTIDGEHPWVDFEWEQAEDIWLIKLFNTVWARYITGAELLFYREDGSEIMNYTLWEVRWLNVIELDMEFLGLIEPVKRMRLTFNDARTGRLRIALREIEVFNENIPEDGYYLIDSDGAWGQWAFDVYCDMTTEEWGWTRLGDNLIENGNLSDTNHSINYPDTNSTWNQENNIISFDAFNYFDSPSDTSLAIKQISRLWSNFDISYPLNISMPWNITDGFELRLSAWLHTTGMYTHLLNSEGNSIFNRTLIHPDETIETEGIIEILEIIDRPYEKWVHYQMRVPLYEGVTDVIWELWKGIEKNTSSSNPKVLHFTDLKAELYYK
jgi:hypothetical protein